MKITRIELDQEDVDKIFKILTEDKFVKFVRTKQSANFPLNEIVECYVELELNIIDSERDENNQSHIESINVDFDFWCMIDGEEVETNLKQSAVLDDKINEFYRI